MGALLRPTSPAWNAKPKTSTAGWSPCWQRNIDAGRGPRDCRRRSGPFASTPRPRRQARKIIALAASAPVTTAEFDAALATWPPPPRLAPLSLLLPFGYRVIFAIEISDGPPCRRLALSHPSNPPTLHMLIGLVALAEEFRLARRVDYASWSEVEGTARWFHLAEPA